MRLLRLLMFVLLLTAILSLVACSSGPSNVSASTPATAEKKQPALSTASACLARMSDQALRWQPDALPFSMESEANEEANGQDGRATVWRARFASAYTLKSRTFNCSGSRLKESPPLGVTAEREVAYRPGLTVMTFSPHNVAVDSDKVASVAQENGGANFIKKDAQQPMIYQLGYDPKTKKLIWLAVIGKAQEDSKMIYIVDASQPKFLGSFKR